MKPFLFVSYSRRDQQFAMKLTVDLENSGAEVWIDQLKIPAGDFFETRIVDAIRKSNFVVVLLSNNSIRSDWVRQEVLTSKTVEKESGRILLLPGKIDDCSVPSWISDKSFVDFTLSYDAALRQLVLAVGGTPPDIVNMETLVKELLEARTSDGKRNLLHALYGRSFEYEGQWVDKKIIDNILAQLATPTSSDGISLDIDTGKIVGDVPLILKDINDLINSLQNAHQIIEKGDHLIKQLYDIPMDAVCAKDAIYRTIVLDIEARIKTPFRQILPIGGMDIETERRSAQLLSVSTVQGILDQTTAKLQLKTEIPEIGKPFGLENTPYRPKVTALGVEEWFFPAAGYNIT